MYDAIIVGAGLFGQCIGARLRQLGLDVFMIDAKEPEAGSRPSAGLMKPSWFAGLGKDIHDPALEMLDVLYGLESLEFKVGPAKAKVFRVAPSKVLSHAPDVGRVMGISGTRSPDWAVHVEGVEEPLEAPLVVVAAGVWTGDLLDVDGLQGKAGVSFAWEGQLKSNFIRPWAPYKQTVGFNQDENSIWCGDGSAILPKNWDGERQAKCLDRCAKAVKKPKGKAAAQFGIRPFIKKCKPCYLEEREPGLWIATGGAKHGMLGAGYAAHVIGKAAT